MPSVMSASRPAALSRGPRAKPKSPALAWRGSRPAAAKRAATPGCIRPARIRFRPWATRQRLLRSRRTTSATVPSATRSSSASSRGCSAGGELAALAQLGAQRQQHVEGDADAGELLAGEAAARLARIDDHVGLGQAHLAVDDRRQVVVGDHDREPVRRGMGDAFEAGDAVVDRQQHVGRFALEREIDDRRRQAVAVDAPVGHDVGERRRLGAEHAQAAQHHGAGGGAVAVVVGDDADPAAGADRVGEQLRGRGRAEQARRRQQRRQAVVELVGGAHAAGGEQARQQRMHARLLERPGGARRHVAGLDRHRRQGHRVLTGLRARRAPRSACQRRRRRCSRPCGRRLEAGGAALAAQGQASASSRSARGDRLGVEPLPGLGPGRPVAGEQRRAQRARRRSARRRRRPPAPGRSRSARTSSPPARRAPRAPRSTGWAWKTSWASLCSRRMRRPTAERVSPSQRSTLRPITRSSDAVAKPSSSSWPTYQRSGAPQAAAKPSLSNSPRIASNRARDSASPRPSPAGSSMVAWSRPSSQCAGVTRPQARSPMATPSAARGPGGEGQGAVAAAPAAGGGEGALVRRREAVGRAVVAGRGLEPRQQAREVRQGEVAKHVPAGFRIVGSEGNEQVHGTDYPRANARPEAQASSRMPAASRHCATQSSSRRRSRRRSHRTLRQLLLTARAFSRTLGSQPPSDERPVCTTLRGHRCARRRSGRRSEMPWSTRHSLRCGVSWRSRARTGRRRASSSSR